MGRKRSGCRRLSLQPRLVVSTRLALLLSQFVKDKKGTQYPFAATVILQLALHNDIQHPKSKGDA
jgi:hypothetical protein